MVSRHPSGALQLSDGRLVYGDTLLSAQDLIEILPAIAPPSWPISPGGGRSASAGGGGSAGPQGAVGPQGASGTAASGIMAEALAHVKAEGSTIAQKGFEKIGRGGPGIYDLILTTSIPADLLVANVTLRPPHDAGGINYIASIGVHPSDGKSLRVKVVDPSMKPADYAFMVVVFRIPK